MADTDYTSEQWRAIDCAPHYSVSNLGRVRNLAGLILSPMAGPYGHLQVVLQGGGARQCKTVHNLLCAAFHGPAPSDKHEAAHKDGNPGHNTPENIYWATHRENTDDRMRHGTSARGDRSGPRIHRHKMPRGSRHPQAKLTEAVVAEIKAVPKQRGDSKVLAARYGVSLSLINQIRRGAIWKPL